MLFCTGLGLLLSSLAVFFSDVIHLWGVVTTAWMYATPIFYPLELLPDTMQSLMVWNPMYQYITYFRALLGYSKHFIDEQFDSIVDFAEVGDFIDMPLKNYSSGMVARIAFAIATATTPDILVVDEALSVGDFKFQEKCEARISDLVENHGTTLLFVSHSIEQVERVCKKAVWIEKGHMRMQGSVEEVCEAYRAL